MPWLVLGSHQRQGQGLGTEAPTTPNDLGMGGDDGPVLLWASDSPMDTSGGQVSFAAPATCQASPVLGP